MLISKRRKYVVSSYSPLCCCMPMAEIDAKSGLLKFSRNLGAISELYVPEG